MADASFCPRYHKAVELIGRRWTGAIVRSLLAGPARYCSIRDAIPDISDRMLAERLRELESEGLVHRHVAASTPVRVEYELTAKGEALRDVVTSIARWAEHWVDVPAFGAASDAGSGAGSGSVTPADIPVAATVGDSVGG